MAILRERLPLPGKLGKIFDIRIGLPREKDIDYAKRYKDQKPNENTRINKFRSLVSSAEGLARPNRFIAIVNLPSALKGVSPGNPSGVGSNPEFAQYSIQSKTTQDLNNVIRDRLFFFCDSAQLPARNISDETKDQLYGPERKIARGHTWADLTLTFYMGQQMIEKMLFESWQNMAVNPFTFNANYYDEYVGSIELYPLVHLTNPNFEPWDTDGGGEKLTPMQRLKNVNKWAKEGKLPPKAEVKKKPPGSESRAMAIASVGAYYNHLVEAFPTNIAVQPMSYDANNSLMKLSVDFSYRYARGPADIDAEHGAVSKGALRPGHVSVEDWKAKSRLESILSGVGRDILNDVKRRFPWGKIFGGKVIPPFF